MPTDPGGVVRIPRPILTGVVSGIAISVSIISLNILNDAQGHAMLVAAIATPYLVFALLDGSARSLVSEITVMVAFVTAAFLVFDAPAWTVAIVLAAHGLWDVAHLKGGVTSHTGDYPIWCGTLDVTAAAVLVIAQAL